ncbi:MAG TPA: HRDC domain-containing protein [Levilinea sp.]|nr:HRDC domain-containing protein [Levilinea sp.]
MKKPVWIDRPHMLDSMVRELEKCTMLAVDTESNSLYVYQEQVCLIQFSTGDVDYLVDPLALSDLSMLSSIFSSANIEKIFHAAEYDMICLKRDFGFKFTNIFDTMVAARVLGKQAVGLAAILKETYGVELDKRCQRANWGRRPLPPPLLAYARLDTHYLIELRNRLKAELEGCGRWELAREDFERVCKTGIPNTENGLGACYRIPGSQDLSPTQLGVLHALCEYRAEQARQANLPPFKILSNQTLLQIASSRPRSVEELQQVQGLSPRQILRHSFGLLEAVQQGLELQPVQRNQFHTRPNEAFLYRLETLRSWRKNTGEALGVPSDVILPREVLEMIAQANPKQMDELAEIMCDLPHRLEKFGSKIMNALRP